MLGNRNELRGQLTLGLIGEKIVHLGCGSVVGNDGETVVVDVKDEVLALLKEGTWGEKICDVEVMKFTMTAKPMRPISPLRVDKVIKQYQKKGSGDGMTYAGSDIVNNQLKGRKEMSGS